MKIRLFSTLLSLGFAAASAQHLHLETDSLPQARQKLLLVVVAPPAPSAQLSPALRQARSQSGLQAPAVARALAPDVPGLGLG